MSASLLPLDLSGLRDAPPEEVSPILERVSPDTTEEELRPLGTLLLNRTLQLLRMGSHQEILAESLMLSRFLEGSAGRSFARSHPASFGGWSLLEELLATAARSSDRAAVDSILRSRGLGQTILELLAAEGRALPRSDIRRRLGVTESHLSHLLRDLEEADLITRYRPEGAKEVLVDLGTVGRNAVDRSVLPPWVERVVREFSRAEGAALPVADELAREIEELGAPSRLAATRLATAVADQVRKSSQWESERELLRNEYSRLRLEAQEKIDKLMERIKALNQRLIGGTSAGARKSGTFGR